MALDRQVSPDKGLIEGIDISATMVKSAERKNKKFISQEKMIITHGDFEKENYDENRFLKLH
jgi:ubiquinone/menaquinone biosynthesis C-methylase UbiE